MSDAIVLQTYPLKESDLIVSFFTREAGKLRGVAKRARYPKSNFGSGLERLSQVNMAYFQRENRELVNLDSCELLQSQFSLLSDYPATVSLDYISEVSGHLLPDAEPNERFFRLLVSALEHLHSTAVFAAFRAVTYFTFWAVRLTGIMPEIHACMSCGVSLDEPEQPERAFFRRGTEGLLCGDCRRVFPGGEAWELSQRSRDLILEMRHTPLSDVSPAWERDTASDLRRFLVQQIESHIDRRLVTPPVLEAA